MLAKAILTDTYQTKLNVDGFEYTLDRSVDKGGKNTGTSPHGMLLGSVLGCKIMVAKGYLDQSDLAYDRVEAEAESDVKGGKGTEAIDITVNLKVFGANLSEKELGYMDRIVERSCTIANILTANGENTVTTNISVE